MKPTDLLIWDDHGAYLWWQAPIEVEGYLGIEGLGLPEDLASALESWGSRSPGLRDQYGDTQYVKDFDEEGRVLAGRLESFLGPSVRISYLPLGSNEMIEISDAG